MARVYTYFIQAAHGGPVKIGIAANVDERRAALQCGNPDELRVVGKVVGDGERLLHYTWREHRIRGEWFKPVAEMLEWAPELRLDDERPPLDQLEVERDAYLNGWNRALDEVAARMPDRRREVFDVAEDEVLARSIRLRCGTFSEKTFPLSSHVPVDPAITSAKGQC